jgi:hypothetical protein
MMFIKVQTPSLEMIMSTCYLDVWNVEEARHCHKFPLSQFGNRTCENVISWVHTFCTWMLYVWNMFDVNIIKWYMFMYIYIYPNLVRSCYGQLSLPLHHKNEKEKEKKFAIQRYLKVGYEE